MSVHPESRDFTNPGAYKRAVVSASSFDQMVEALPVVARSIRGFPGSQTMGASQQGSQVCSHGSFERFRIRGGLIRGSRRTGSSPNIP
jgi:hypothetical protein